MDSCRCDDCKWWIEKPFVSIPDSGECRLNAPGADAGGGRAHWPRTLATDGCGQWGPKNNPSGGVGGGEGPLRTIAIGAAAGALGDGIFEILKEIGKLIAMKTGWTYLDVYSASAERAEFLFLESGQRLRRVDVSIDLSAYTVDLNPEHPLTAEAVSAPDTWEATAAAPVSIDPQPKALPSEAPPARHTNFLTK